MKNTSTITINHDDQSDTLSVNFTFAPGLNASGEGIRPEASIALALMDYIEEMVDGGDDADGNVASAAEALVADRRKTYGDPVVFFEGLAARWSLTLGIDIAPEQVVLCMLDLKHERLCRNPEHIDSILDTAGYAQILKEVVA